MSNIIGLGLDATDIPRIAATIERYGERFMHRIFTDGEIAYCTGAAMPAIHFAGRFAAKEAAMKALGTGHSQSVLWRDVEVVRRGGPPQLQFHGGAARRFAAMGAQSSLLTITHSDTLALAQVLHSRRAYNAGCHSQPPGRALPRPAPSTTRDRNPACFATNLRAHAAGVGPGTALDVASLSDATQPSDAGGSASEGVQP